MPKLHITQLKSSQKKLYDAFRMYKMDDLVLIFKCLWSLDGEFWRFENSIFSFGYRKIEVHGLLF